MSEGLITDQVKNRQKFVIISYPDPCKTALTEALLLFSSGIQMAGVKVRKASQHTASDWMAIEKQCVISVASSVMQMEYRSYAIKLLDTPSHQDFSED
jgi:peptide chain release factor 3